MIRFVQIAAAVTVMTVPVLAHAETSLTVRIDPTVSAAEQQAGIAAQADAFCRANPVGGTVAACKQEVTAQLTRAAAVKTQQYAKAHSALVLARR